MIGREQYNAYADLYSPDNIGLEREKISRALLATEDNESALVLTAILHDLKEMGIPLITAAGNDYSGEYINLIGLHGGISIGALTYDGSSIAPYSNNNSLTSQYRIGDYIARATGDGIDINNDGITDFDQSLLSDDVTLADIYNGQNLEYTSLRSTVTKMIDNGVDASRAVAMESIYGEFTLGGKYYRLQPDGTVQFDPANDGDNAQRSITVGTSFAAPAICTK